MILAGAVGVGAVFALRHSGLQLARVTSNSMIPFARGGDWVVVQARSEPATSWVRRGDVVAFRYPFGSSGRAMKRVAALPWDRVEFGPDGAVVNGPVRPSGRAALQVPPGALFVMGDNVRASIDSRHFGPLPEHEITGRVACALPAAGAYIALGMAAAVALLAFGGTFVAPRRRVR